MKKSALILLFITLSVNSQTQINALNGNLTGGSSQTDGFNYRSYVMFDPTTSFNQSSAGFDKIWDISSFTELTDSKSYRNTTPTSTELADYPGIGMVTTGSVSNSGSPVIDSKTYAIGPVSGWIGYSDSSIILNYSTDNVDFGSFPMLYGDLHLDTISGTYILGEYSGTFAGTMITEVDAYGNMITASEGIIAVTRLKTIETLQINYSGFGDVGTFIQTTYRYYRATDLWPFLKSTNKVINIPLLGLNTDTTNIEKAPAVLLDAENFELNNSISVFPNPFSNKININANDNQKVNSVTVTDILGKIILTKKETTSLDLSALQSGTYLVKIETNDGVVVKKIVKK